ncbi:retrovirus-related pol polyprotein from transposon TNT 1-94 [Tanacetum coccineum]
MALLAQSFRATLPQMNNQLRTSSNTRNQATIQDGRVDVQNVQGRQNQNQNQRYLAQGNGAAGNGGTQNRAGNANAGQGKPVKCYNCNGIRHIAWNCTQPKLLDEEELLFLAGEHVNTFDADVHNQPVQVLALNEDNIFQADECDAFDSDVDDKPTAQSIFMANLSSADLTAKLNALQDLNECFRAENTKVKQHYKELYDSIKITSAKTTDQNNFLLPEIEHLKDQLRETSKCVNIPDCKPKVLAPGRYPIDVEPIPSWLKKNREVHLHYIKRLKENVETLREIVDDA